jgi:hypothetical protein
VERGFAQGLALESAWGQKVMTTPECFFYSGREKEMGVGGPAAATWWRRRGTDP